MSGPVVLFVGDPGLCEAYGGTLQSYNWLWGVLYRHLFEMHATLLVGDGSAGPADLAFRVAHMMEISWRSYQADGLLLSEECERSTFLISRWRGPDALPASFVERNRTMLDFVLEQGKTRHCEVLALRAPWATDLESRPGNALVMQAMRAGLRIVEFTCPPSFGRGASDNRSAREQARAL